MPEFVQDFSAPYTNRSGAYVQKGVPQDKRMFKITAVEESIYEYDGPIMSYYYHLLRTSNQSGRQLLHLLTFFVCLYE